MEYKNYLVLMYYNTAKELATYKDMVDFLGYTYQQIEDLINELVKENYLAYQESNLIGITENGKYTLEEKGLIDIDFYSIYNNAADIMIDEGNLGRKINITDLYIPIDFDKKFKGYR